MLAREFNVTPSWISKLVQDIDLTERRFWSHVDRRGPDECWPWTGLRVKGYGQFKAGGRYMRAHRQAFFYAGGSVTEAEPLVLHSCDNPPCCNPAHLSAGNTARNIQEREARGRRVTTFGENNPASKLTAVQVSEIRNRFTGAKGQQAALAREFNTSPTNVLAITNRKTWKDTTP